MSCIFCEIIKGNINAVKAYEDDDMIIIKDVAPQAEIHYLLIPKSHYADITQMSEIDAQTLGKCLLKLGKLADGLGLEKGFRIVSNKGENACQSVGHLHLHILGGEKLSEKMC